MPCSSTKGRVLLRDPQIGTLLRNTLHGVEREGLRISPDGSLSMQPHPMVLGSPLKHPSITTDGLEAHIELVTNPIEGIDALLERLTQLHQFTMQCIPGELLWASSMPGQLPKADCLTSASYGRSLEAEGKHLYTRGLNLRYGKEMHTISGIHHNVSFGMDLWKVLYQHCGHGEGLSRFVSEGYLAITRNFRRFCWLHTYLFGASPMMDASLLSHQGPAVSFPPTPDAISLRQSPIGYTNREGIPPAISHNDLPSFIRDFRYALATPDSVFSQFSATNDGLPLQYNDHILQMENEYYAMIRARSHQHLNGEHIQCEIDLKIEYLEVRSLDLDPFSPIGVSADQLHMMYLFLLFSLCQESPPMERAEEQQCYENLNRVALHGRNSSCCMLTPKGERPLQQVALSLLTQMVPVADLLNQEGSACDYRSLLDHQIQKVAEPDRTLAGSLLSAMKEKEESFTSFTLRQSKRHRQTLQEMAMDKAVEQELAELAEASLRAQGELESHEHPKGHR